MKFRHAGALVAFGCILLFFLVVQDSILILQQKKMLTSMAGDHFEDEMELLAAASLESVLKQDYVNVRSFVSRWGDAHEEYRQLRAVAPNGFVIAEFTRPGSPQKPVYHVNKRIQDGDRLLMTLEMTGDYSQTDKVVGMLKKRQVIGSLLFTALLGCALWYAVKRQALVPLETEVAIRKQAEKQLEAKVEERTRELKKELAERRRVEEELLEREERIRLLLDSTAEAIYGVDVTGICTFCNPSCLRMLGYERQEDLIGKSIHQMIHHTRTDGSHYSAADCRIYEVSRTGRGCHTDDELFWRSDGSCFPAEYWSYPVTRGEEIIGAVVTFIDISERRKLQEALLQSQKMEAIGRLAGGIAHDFNNILTAIVGYASILQKKISDDSLKSGADHILEASRRAVHLIRGLLAFGRKQTMTPKPVNLNSIIANVETLLLRIIGADIVLRSERSADELNVMADASQMEQVLMNLASNARDAMPSGGSLTIRSESVMLKTEQLAVYGSGLPGPYALVTITDTGAGMDNATRKKIFEPFFTTKDVGKGTGLGLSIVYAIIKQHNGFLNVYSEPGKGSVFRIYLPLIGTKPVEQERLEEKKDHPRGSETILVAEDDPSIRSLARTVLEDAGYTVIAAENGEDAVRKFNEYGRSIHLALLDVIMPGMNGRTVYEEMKKTGRDVKVLFLSGYAGDLLAMKGILEKEFEFLQKPVAPGDLLLKVRTMLDGGK